MPTTAHLDPVDPAQLADLAAAVARRAGALLLDGLRADRALVETKSSPTDLVSEMDRAAEKLIRVSLLASRPDDAILGEEEGEAAGSSNVRWIVDPLDGTTNYLYGFPAWCVSVAAEVDGQVLAGAVFDPGRNEMFVATAGGGATCEGRVLAVAGPPVLATALVGTGFGYTPERRAEQGAWLAHVLPRVRDIRRAGSAALDLCWVAAGRLDAYYELGIQVWDYAAGALIATEAGAWVGGFDGGPPSSAGFVVACPQLAEALLGVLAEASGTAQP